MHTHSANLNCSTIQWRTNIRTSNTTHAESTLAIILQAENNVIPTYAQNVLKNSKFLIDHSQITHNYTRNALECISPKNQLPNILKAKPREHLKQTLNSICQPYNCKWEFQITRNRWITKIAYLERGSRGAFGRRIARPVGLNQVDEGLIQMILALPTCPSNFS